jgi:hypothetical protein
MSQEKTPKRKFFQAQVKSDMMDESLFHTRNRKEEEEHDILSVSNDSSLDREESLEYSCNHSTYSNSHSDNTNSNNEYPNSSMEKHETRTGKKRGRKRKHPEMVSWKETFSRYYSSFHV